MEKFDPIDIDFIINNSEVKASTEKVKTDLKSVGQTAEETAAKVNSQLKGAFGREDNASAVEALNKGLKEQGAIVTRNKPAYNGLGNSINQISREMSAFTVSAQTGFLAVSNNIPILADEINRLKARNAELTASGQKAVPVWKQVVKGLFSWGTALSVGITLLTIYGSEVVKWVSTLFKGKDAIDELKASQKALNDTFSSGSYKKVIGDVLQLQSYIKLAKEGVIDKDVALKKYNETLGKVSTAVTNLADAEQGVIDKAPAYVKAMLYKSAAAAASAEAAAKLAESTKRQNEIEEEIKAIEKRKAQPVSGGFSPTAPGSVNVSGLKQQADINNANKELNALIAERNKLNESSLKVVTKLNEEAAKIAKDAGLDIFGEEENNKNKTVSAYQSLLDKLSELDKEYSRKSFTKDEEELQALRDKFDKIRQLVERFNADPKNKAEIIDLSNLDQLQVKAEASLTYRQTTDKLKEELNAQKQLFKEYEDYKQKLGKEEADKRYADELKGFDSYLAALQDKIKNNDVAFKAVELGTAEGPQTERVQLLQNALKNEQLTTDAHFKELLAKYRDFEQQRQLLTERYQKEYSQLMAAGRTNEANARTREFKEDLDKIAQAELSSTDAYKRLLNGVENLSKTAAQTIIDEARRMVEALLQAGNISQVAADDILQKLDEAQKKINEQDKNNATSEYLNKRANELSQLSAAFLELGNALQSYDEGLADTITTVGELLEVTSNAAKAGASFASGDIIGGISSSINAIAGIFRIGAKARESQRQAEQQLLELQHEREDGERRLNKLQRERNLAKAKEIELTIEGLKAQRAALELSKLEAKQDEQALFRELQGGQYITGSKTEKYGGFLGIGRKTRVVNTYGSLLGKTFEEIEAFYERGLLEGRVEKLFEQIRQLKEEGQNIDDLLKQIENDTREALTGTTETSIADSIINGLKQGYRSFEDFAGDIESLLQNAILNSIKFNALEEPIKALYEEFANFAESEGELSTAEADALRSRYQELVQNAINQYNQLSGIINEDLIDTQTPDGLSGRIRRELTEETGGELLGLFRGQYDVTKRLLEATEIYYEKENRHQANLIDLISINTKIESNTANTVLELQTAVVELRKIAENTDKIYLNDIGG